MKLEVDMFVRTKDGFIAKIKEIKANERLHLYLKTIYTDNFHMDMVLEDEILKASHNIIDLIEENDYIRIVTSAFYEPVYYSYGKLVIRDDIDISKYTNKFIAEVITHEQMKSMSYRVEGEE